MGKRERESMLLVIHLNSNKYFIRHLHEIIRISKTNVTLNRISNNRYIARPNITINGLKKQT